MLKYLHKNVFMREYAHIWLQMVQILKGFWNPEAQPFEIRINGHHFVKKPFEIQTKMFGFKMVRFSKVLDFSYCHN